MRSIRPSERYERERAAFVSSIQRWDDLIAGIEWALSTKPEMAGQPTAVAGVFAIPTEPWPNVPKLVIYFKYDAEFVELLSVIAADLAAPD